jgi:DNA polymerase-3 subunit alpha
MVAKAKELGMEGIALTDHGKLGGLIQLSKSCKEHKIKGVPGLEAYVVDDLQDNKGKRFHQTILAKNNIGLKNLYKLATISSSNLYRGFPRLDWNILKDHSEGLIIFSGCVVGKFASLIISEKIDEAKKLAKFCKDIWGEDYYIEVMWTGYEPQKLVLRHGVDIAKELGIKIVATNDAHYTEKSDGESQRVKISISRNGPMEKDDYLIHHMFLKSYDEMIKTLGAGRAEYLHITSEILSKCEAEIKLGQAKLPIFEIPTGNEAFNSYRKTLNDNVPQSEAYLNHLAYEGLKRRNLWDKNSYRERLEKELETIKFTGFDTYFLIVEDYCAAAKNLGVAIGCGRGSGAGSLVLYSLGVTNIDPMKYDLSMDRFLFAEANYHARISDFFEQVSEGLSDDIEKNVQLLDDAKDLSVVEDKGCLTGVLS